MKRDDLADLLREVHALLGELESDRAMVRAYDALTEWARGRGWGRGGSGGRSAGHSDPTFAAVEDDARRAEARKLIADRDEMADGLLRAVHGLERAVRIQRATLTPKRPIRHKPGCSICDSVRGDDGQPHHLSYQEVKARGLCGWHYRFKYGDGPERPGFGVDPVDAINRWHLDHLGEEVRPSMVRDHMPDAFNAREQRKRRPGICGHPTFLNGVEGVCVRPFMHDGQCLDEAHMESVA